jgi:FkbM family methyltransferase
MKGTNNPDALGTRFRVRRFMRRPWHEKVESIKNRLRSVGSKIPVPVRLPLGLWWMKRNDNLAEPLLAGAFENAELAFVDKFLQPGMTVLDIGAHQGLYSLVASRRVGPAGRVFSFEPSPRERRALRLNLAINFSLNVTVQGLALGSLETTADLYVVQGYQTGCNSLRPPEVLSSTKLVRVNITTLDRWLSQHPISHIDLIKLDVEGAELDVLRGAKSLLTRDRGTIILCELQDVRSGPWGHKAKDVAALLQDLGFKWHRCDSNGDLIRVPDNFDQFEGNFVAARPEGLDYFDAMIRRN